MEKYQFLCLVIVATSGIGPCLSQSSVQSTQDTTPASLLRELEDNSRYKTLEANATLLKLLVDDKGGVSKSEVFDMLHSKDDNEEHVDLPVFPEDAEEGRVDVLVVPDSQAEFLQASDSVRKDSQKLHYAGAREPAGEAAGIMVVVTCAIVALAYTALVVWRRIYFSKHHANQSLMSENPVWVRNKQIPIKVNVNTAGKKHGLKHELLRNEEIAETRIEL